MAFDAHGERFHSIFTIVWFVVLVYRVTNAVDAPKRPVRPKWKRKFSINW